MPITLSDAIRRTRSRLDEPAYPTLPGSTSGGNPARFYTDTEITDWINDACRDIARRAEDLHTYDTTIAIPAYTQTPSQGIPTYPLNIGVQPGMTATTSDVLRITRVEFQVANDASQIYPLEWQTQAYMDQIWNINQISTMSYPAYWTTRGFPGGTGRSAFVIQLYPQPAQGGQLNIFYYRLPARIGDPAAATGNVANYNATIDVIEGWDDLVVDYAVMQGLLKARNPDFQTAQQLYEVKLQNLIDNTRHVSDQAQFMSYDNMVMSWSFDSWGGL